MQYHCTSIVSILCCRYLNPLVFGDYPDVIKKNAGSRIPSFTRLESQSVKGSFDFIGFNYYTAVYTKDNSISLKSTNRDYVADSAVKLTRKLLLYVCLYIRLF